MKIDIFAQELPPHTKVWRCFPGWRYGLRNTFLAQNCVFLEFPDILFDVPLEIDGNLYSKIFASQQLADLVRLSGPDSRPVIRWQDYIGIPVDKTLGRQRGAALDLYVNAKAGDIVVVPDHKHRRTIYIGQFLDEAADRFYVEDQGRYFNYSFPARRVRWLEKVNENFVSPDFSHALRHEHAFGDLGERNYNEAFGLAFGNFIGNGVYSSIVANGSDSFTDSDNAFIGVIFTLAAYACQAYEEGKETFEIEDVFEFVLNRPPLEYACLFASKHNSPGFTRYIGLRGTALVAAGAIAGLMALSEEADAAEIQAKAASIEFVNTRSAAGGPCDIDVQGPGRVFFKSIGGDKLIKACQTMAETSNRAKLGVRARARR